MRFQTLHRSVWTLCLLAVLSMNIGSEDLVRKAADEVIARELAFSARAQQINPRDAFLEFFAADALMFRPGPVSARTRLLSSQAWAVNIQWWPIEVAVSADGCLAYSTGPAEYRRDPASPLPDSVGSYFSIWRKNSAGVWEVAADLGIDTPGLSADRQDPVRYRLPPPGNRKPDRSSRITAVDGNFARSAATDLAAALARLASPDYRLLLPDQMPLIGFDSARTRLQPGSCAWTSQGEIVAASGDFGVSYGSGQGGYASGPFGFLRVWQQDEQGQWRILAEVINLGPAS